MEVDLFGFSLVLVNNPKVKVKMNRFILEKSQLSIDPNRCLDLDLDQIYEKIYTTWTNQNPADTGNGSKFIS